MIYSRREICVLDTNVIYPLLCRDILFWFASYDLFIPKWSRHIFDEWRDVMTRKGLPIVEIDKRINIAKKAFPDAMVKNYEPLMDELVLPDEKDRHVLAAAIKAKAQIIVTNNLKDFPNTYLASFNITAKKPDTYLSELIHLEPDMSFEAFLAMVSNKKHPKLDAIQVLEGLRKIGLNGSADALKLLL